MATHRRKFEWAQTAATIAMIAECHRDTKKRSEPYTSDDFNPMAESKLPTLTMEEMWRRLPF